MPSASPPPCTTTTKAVSHVLGRTRTFPRVPGIRFVANDDERSAADNELNPSEAAADDDKPQKQPAREQRLECIIPSSLQASPISSLPTTTRAPGPASTRLCRLRSPQSRPHRRRLAMRSTQMVPSPPSNTSPLTIRIHSPSTRRSSTTTRTLFPTIRHPQTAIHTSSFTSPPALRRV